MDWAERRRERLKKIEAERVHLLSITEDEAREMGVEHWYQRMRYLREIEAAAWLDNVKRNLPKPVEEQSQSQKRHPKNYGESNIVVFGRE